MKWAFSHVIFFFRQTRAIKKPTKTCKSFYGAQNFISPRFQIKSIQPRSAKPPMTNKKKALIKASILLSRLSNARERTRDRNSARWNGIITHSSGIIMASRQQLQSASDGEWKSIIRELLNLNQHNHVLIENPIHATVFADSR